MVELEASGGYVATYAPISKKYGCFVGLLGPSEV